MRLYEFRRKSTNQQVYLLGQFGIKLLERSVGIHDVSLYYMDYFFVELWLSSHMPHKVRLVSFRDHTCFEPYLDSIKLSDLNLS